MPDNDSKQWFIRSALIADVERIYKLMSPGLKDGQLLPRSRMDLYAQVRDFFVAETASGELIGTAALHIYWLDMGEVRSVIVAPDYRGRGLGADLVETCVADAVRMGLERVCVLTNSPDYFAKRGFGPCEKSDLPHKVWLDCVHCLKFPDCDEWPMVRKVEAS